MRGLLHILSGFLVLCISLFSVGNALSAQSAPAEGKPEKDIVPIDAPSSSLGDVQELIDQILKQDPGNKEALQLKKSLENKQGPAEKEFKKNLWEGTTDQIDGPYIEIPEKESVIRETLSLDPRNKEALEQLKQVSEKKFSLANFLASLEGDRWGGGFRIGLYDPALTALNQGVFKGPFGGGAGVFKNPKSAGDGNEPVKFAFDNDVPEMDLATEAGIEFKWDRNRRSSYLIGLGSWEGNAKSPSKEVAIPIQNRVTRADMFRRAQFSFTQFYVGWKYNLFRWPDRLRFYTRLTANEYFDIDYREDHIYNFKEFDIDGFKRIMILRAQTTGAFAFSAGLGGEYFWKDWLSLGIEAERVFSFSSFNLRNVQRNSDFSDSEQASFAKLPYAFDASGNMLFRKKDGTTERVDLRFDSWKLLFNITFYY
ncbi:MAG: hypothetical protein D6698_01450 [Gammaproteobacteria bacterium]|nr:MAG: hypothetical protein D6698_01450 [Gammaproteobacteria bacterium]